MSLRRNHERLRLFRLYSKNFANHCPDAAGIFVCPICGQPYHEPDVLTGTGLKVDLGHIFPQEIGGTHVVLECCACNGRLNRLGDSELVKLYKQWDAMRADRPGRPIRGHILMPSGKVGVDIRANSLYSHQKNAQPEAFKEVVLSMQKGSIVEIAFPQVCQKRINVALLHSAHLLFFREFGYGYLFTDVGRHVRQLLLNADSLPDDAFMSIEVPRSASIDPAIIFRIGVCRMPDGEKCLFAALPVADPRALCHMLLLPGPWDEAAKDFKRVLDRSETWIHTMQCQTIDRRIWQHLVAPEYSNALALAWKGAKPHQVDMTKLMWAIRAEAKNKTERKIDAARIGKRFGFGQALEGYVQSLAARGFLERAPKRQRPNLVRLTKKALAVSR